MLPLFSCYFLHRYNRLQSFYLFYAKKGNANNLSIERRKIKLILEITIDWDTKFIGINSWKILWIKQLPRPMLKLIFELNFEWMESEEETYALPKKKQTPQNLLCNIEVYFSLSPVWCLFYFFFSILPHTNYDIKWKQN